MTLEEAINILGTAILAVLIKHPGYEVLALQLYHALIEEWMDGSLTSINKAGDVTGVFDQYGSNTLQQAARVVANKVDIYGDVG